MNIKSLSLLDPKLWPKLKIWPLTLDNDLDLIMLPIKSCSSWDTRVHWTSTVYLYVINSYDPWPLKVTLTLTCHTPKCVALWDIHACQILSLYLFWFKRYGYLTFDLEGWPWPWHVMFKLCSFKKIHIHNKYQVSISIGSKVMAQTLNLTFDLAEWPWHYAGTTQNMRLCEIHLYTKYQISISIGSKVMAKTLYLPFDLEEWPWPYDVTTQKCAALWDLYVHQISNVYLYWIKSYGQCYRPG